MTGSVAERARELGMRSAVGCPIVVGSRTWGVMTVATYGADPFAPETEARVGRFSDLVATAIANAERARRWIGSPPGGPRCGGCTRAKGTTGGVLVRIRTGGGLLEMPTARCTGTR
jgi:hypothetical protein